MVHISLFIECKDFTVFTDCTDCKEFKISLEHFMFDSQTCSKYSIKFLKGCEFFSTFFWSFFN